MTTTPTSPRRRSLIVAGTALAAGPALFHIARAQAAPIRIGFPVPLTGPFSAEAQDQVRAAELAVKEWNAAGGHKGQMCELLVRDTKLNSGEAATRTLELIEKDKVNFVVGSLSAATQLSSSSRAGCPASRRCADNVVHVGCRAGCTVSANIGITGVCPCQSLHRARGSPAASSLPAYRELWAARWR